MDGLSQQVRRILVDRAGLRGSALVVGVSGGLDSMVLLHALARIAPRLGIHIEVAHCHHGLRGREADRDEKLVRETATRLGVGFQSAKVDVRGAAESSGESVEMAARRLRHRFLAQTAVGLGTPWVVLAHHADDQAELVLLRLFRGAGSDGLSGMTWTSPSPADDRVRLVRPLLGHSRADLERVAAGNGIRFRNDRSNRDTRILRNRIRLRILPFLCRELTPALPRILNRVAEIASAEAEYLESEAARWRREGPESGFADLPLALQRTVVRQRLLELGQVPDFEGVETLREALSKPTPPSLPKASKAPLPHAFPRPEIPVGFGRSGSVAWRNGVFRWKITRTPPGPREPGECLDADRVGRRAVLRVRRKGDIYRPLGMPQTARLKGLLINHKIPREVRDSRLVVEIPDGRIAWVEGLPPGEDFRRHPGTRRWIRFWWEPGD